ncbi:MAG: porin family protein [Methylobacteriaceae bacterium]|nr:porin family protein [Methylobacteriaceae bacterium]
MFRRLILSTAAIAAMIGSAAAADLPSRRPPPPVAYVPPVPIFTWTGFYVGVNAGGAFRANNDNGFNNAAFFGGASPFATANVNNSARFIGGGQVGVNYQINQFVVGVEGDGQALVGSNNNNNTFGFVGNGSTTSFLGTVRGRAGLAFDRVLVYGTGGVAFGGGNNNWPNTIIGNIGGAPTFFTANNGNNTRVGYAVGAGAEYAFTPNWSVKVEYLFADLGRNNRTYLAPGGLAGFSVNNREQEHIVRAGLNYRFGWGGSVPVLARY